jgi:L-ascorbate metabolism protein UlaG (beta-lactamase superfamily)
MSTQIKITYFDTAMALIEIGRVRLLTDPVFDEKDTHFDHGPVHLEKTGGRAIAPEALGRIDAVLLSHDQHGDNLDHAGRAFLPHARLVLTTTEGAARLGGSKAIGLAAWAGVTVTAPDGSRVVVTGVPAQHGPDGTQEATGPVTGFMLDWPGREAGPIYVSGDTVQFTGTAEIVQRYAPVGLAFLNIGRVRLAPMGDLEFTMSAEEAAAYAEALGAAWIVPLHFNGWRHFSQSQAEAREVFSRSEVAERVRWPEPGVAFEFAL